MRTHECLAPPSSARPTFTPRGDLSDAYAHCRAICRRFGTTYYLATAFFPRTIRPAVYSLYAWVRYPDEWVDNPGELTIAERRKRLQTWRRETADAIRTGHASHPVLAAWTDAARQCEIPLAEMDAFLDAMEQDLSVATYGTYDDLQRYMWGSASVVGLMMCRLAGATDPRARPHAISLGTAMQLTNFLRDVGEDWRERRRVYLPQEDLQRFGVTRDEWEAGRVTPRFREMMRFEADRARALYAHADTGMQYLPPDTRLPIRLARLLYAAILDEIESNDFDVFARRARVPMRHKLAVVAREWLRRERARPEDFPMPSHNVKDITLSDLGR